MGGRGKAQKNLDLIEAAIRIYREIQPASVRACCYRLLVEGLIPSMEKKHTARVSKQLTDARESGELPWEWVVDEGRRAERIGTWQNPEAIIDAAVRGYRRDHWQDQEQWIEVWSEKGTVRGTLAPVLDKYGVTLRVMHGYSSATVMHDIAEMTAESDKNLTVLYVGDRDPSGMHMSEVDIPERLCRYWGDADVIRIAINDDDTKEEANVRSFPAAKATDSRHRWYVEKYGPRWWELDALSPNVLRDRIESEIRSRLDLDAWDHAVKVEEVERASMEVFFADYPGISGPGKKYGPRAPS
jgi:hypothetical protein